MQGGLGNLRSQLISAEQQLSALRADIRVGMASAADVFMQSAPVKGEEKPVKSA
jgi:hypothetical protein